MSGFFDKVKQGVNETSKQAKIAVETNRLKGQISAKEKEINGKYLEMGRDFYQAFKKDDFASVQATLENLCHEVTRLVEEIGEIHTKIEELKEPDQPAEEEKTFAPAPAPAPASGKTCTCGTEVDADAKFCPTCGNRF